MFFESNEFCEVFKGCFPFYFLFIVPIILVISPTPLVSASHEFTVYRMHQYDLHGLSRGCRSATLNLEARSLSSWNSPRHCVVAKLQHLASQSILNLKENAGGLLLLLPERMDALSPSAKQELNDLEIQLLDDETSVPVYFVKYTREMETILSDIEMSKTANDKGATAWEALFQSFSANGYQIVVNAGKPSARTDANILSIQGKLSGYGVEDKLPTIAIVAHYDSFGGAPELSFGAESNASGVIALLELMRIFSHLYSDSRAHAPVNFLFLLSGGGKFNYQGSKKWLEDQLDNLEGSLLQDAMFVLCMDTVSSNKGLYLHVSKPPKDGSPLANLHNELSSVAKMPVEVVHKKINLADEILAWEHERYSIRRLPAATLSAFKSHKNPARSTMFDVPEKMDLSSLKQNIDLIASALARLIYNLSPSSNYTIHLGADEDMIRSWSDFLTSHPRSATLLFEKNNPFMKSFEDVFNRYLEDVKISTLTTDKRDPEFTFYDTTSSTVNIYNVKPAVFDLFLTVIIVMYLSCVFFIIKKTPVLYSLLGPGTSQRKVKSS